MKSKLQSIYSDLTQVSYLNQILTVVMSEVRNKDRTLFRLLIYQLTGNFMPQSLYILLLFLTAEQRLLLLIRGEVKAGAVL